MGAAYGTAKSGVGVASMGVMRPELVMKSIVPVVMAGVLGIYGLIIAVIISTGINPKAKSYYLFDGYAHLSSGLACGLAGLSAGMAIGIVGDAGVRYNPFLLLFWYIVWFLFADILRSCWIATLHGYIQLLDPLTLTWNTFYLRLYIIVLFPGYIFHCWTIPSGTTVQCL